MKTEKQKRIDKALDFALKYGHIDGNHHKSWLIDQMVRALTGCPMITKRSTFVKGKPFLVQDQGESGEYMDFVAKHVDFVTKYDDKEEESYAYEWDCGIAP